MEEGSISQDNRTKKDKGELLWRGWLRAEPRNRLKKWVRQRNMGRMQSRGSAIGYVRIRREAGGVMNILRDRGKIEAIPAVLGIDIPVVGMCFIPASISIGAGGVAIPLKVLLQTRLSLSAEAPSQTLSMAYPREKMGGKGKQENQTCERRTNHIFNTNIGKTKNATRKFYFGFKGEVIPACVALTSGCAGRLGSSGSQSLGTTAAC
jgi:hypothetical protein